MGAELPQTLQANPAAQPQQNQVILQRKELKIERCGGNGHHNWSDDIKILSNQEQSPKGCWGNGLEARAETEEHT